MTRVFCPKSVSVTGRHFKIYSKFSDLILNNFWSPITENLESVLHQIYQNIQCIEEILDNINHYGLIFLSLCFSPIVQLMKSQIRDET